MTGLNIGYDGASQMDLHEALITIKFHIEEDFKEHE